MKTFKRFIEELRNCKAFEDTPIEDFVGDVGRDRDFPEFANLRQLENHLVYKHACTEARRIARKLYMLWCEVKDVE